MPLTPLTPDGPEPQPGWRRFFFRHNKLHPLWRTGLYLGATLLGSILVQVAIGLIYAFILLLVFWVRRGDPAGLGKELAAGQLPSPLLVGLALANLLWALGVTWAFRRWVDRGPLRDLGLARGAFWRELAAGLGLGLASMIFVLVLHLAFGWARLNPGPAGAAALGTLMSTALILIPAAANEEIIFRGYVLQTLEGWRGWWLALIASSLLFALVHGANPHVTGLALANIALAGVALGLAYRLTRRLWLPIAYHFMWNYAQGPLFGLPVSGIGFGAILKTTVSGPPLWTGGAFGPEGGLVATGLLGLSALGLWWWAHRPRSDRGVPPSPRPPRF